MMKIRSANNRRRRPHNDQWESTMQMACVDWFHRWHPELSDYALFSVPNGAKLYGDARQRAIYGLRLKREGLLKGVADLILFIPNRRYHALCIEMKWHSGQLSPEQRRWGARAEENGYRYVVCKPKDRGSNILTLRAGVALFRDIVDSYLKER